ncbi:MAG: hypothetical protein RLZZ472_1453, partial [Pseudomonadota bacterium]
AEINAGMGQHRQAFILYWMVATSCGDCIDWPHSDYLSPK